MVLVEVDRERNQEMGLIRCPTSVGCSTKRSLHSLRCAPDRNMCVVEAPVHIRLCTVYLLNTCHHTGLAPEKMVGLCCNLYAHHLGACIQFNGLCTRLVGQILTGMCVGEIYIELFVPRLTLVWCYATITILASGMCSGV